MILNLVLRVDSSGIDQMSKEFHKGKDFNLILEWYVIFPELIHLFKNPAYTKLDLYCEDAIVCGDWLLEKKPISCEHCTLAISFIFYCMTGLPQRTYISPCIISHTTTFSIQETIQPWKLASWPQISLGICMLQYRSALSQIRISVFCLTNKNLFARRRK